MFAFLALSLSLGSLSFLIDAARPIRKENDAKCDALHLSSRLSPLVVSFHLLNPD